jgi:flagellar hook protein FlgE
MNFSIGLSGLNAATRRLDAAAFEVARASTQGAGRAQAAPPAADPAAAPPAVAPPVAAPPAAAPPAASASDPDLPRAMVETIAASNAFLANLQTIRRTDEALRALLDERRGR